jgi:hypothetical protein
LKPETEPRKLLVSVLSTLKHGSNGTPRIAAQTASPLIFSVPGGSVTKRIGPLPLIWMVPATDRSLWIWPAPRVPSKQL